MRRNYLGAVPLTEAPPTAAPLATIPAQDFYEEPGDVVLDITLTSNQEKLRQTAQVDSDSDFLLYALLGTSTGAYDLRLQLPNGRYLNNSYVKSSNYVGSAQFPVPLLVPVYFPGGSSIIVDVKDTSGAGNTVQLVFKGVRRYRLAGN